MTTAALTSLAAPLSFVTAETALAAYQMACATGAPESFEAAAHALAGALRCERARRMAPRPPAGVRPRLVVDNDPIGEAAPPPAKASRKGARGAADLDTRLPAPKRGSPAGSFLVEWSDGSTTRVQGVTWAAAKPDTRWAKAYQAANRVRRARFGRLLSAEMGGADAIRGRYGVGPCGVQVDSPAWLDLLACTPLPALAAIVDETLDIRFPAPDGSAYGAGDEARADALMSALCAPRLPWLAAEAAKANDLFRTTGEGVSYWIHRGEGETALHGVGVMSPWPEAYRRNMIHEAEQAFALPVEIVEDHPAVSAGPVEAAVAEDVNGLSVMVTPAGLERARIAETTAADVYEVARLRAKNGQLDADGRDAKAASLKAKEITRALGDAGSHAWAATRGSGGLVKLTRPGHGIVLSMTAVAYLDRVANPAA